MDDHRFDDLTRWLGHSLNRQRFLTILGSAVASVAGLGSADVIAKRNNRRARRRRRVRQRGDQNVTAQGIGVCGGFCNSDADCGDIPNCVCDDSDNRCVSMICGGPCSETIPCQDTPGCSCNEMTGQCETQTCGGTCEEGADCESGGLECICDESAGQCVTITCTGICSNNADCPELEGCVCTVNVPPEAVGQEGIPAGTCVRNTCSGVCDTNEHCTMQGAPSCVCFPGITAASADVRGEGSNGVCGECRGLGESCPVSSVCCGQLVCQIPSGQSTGTCQQPDGPTPGCKEHGEPCSTNAECCRQALCVRGRCGEKNTHCKSNRECAKGYRCRGGRRSPGHRRCRKKGKRRKQRRK